MDQGINYSGEWISYYEYFSDTRNGLFTAQHRVILHHESDRVHVSTQPGSSESIIFMDLYVDHPAVVGTWAEHTAVNGPYHGARYTGAIRLIPDRAGVQMAGEWVGFGKAGKIKSGPWTLTRLTRA